MSSSWAQMSDQAVRRHNESVLSRCEEGDLLEFPRGKFSHWGVYAGDGRVIHRTGDNNGSSGSLSYPQSLLSTSGVKTGKAQVKEDSFWDVAGDSLVKINNYLDWKAGALSGLKIVERARQKVGEVGYNLFWKNCEHFATWCRYGEERSAQVWNCVTNFVAGGAAIVGIGLAVMFSTRKMKQ